jgi:hypothetical protein
MRPAKNVKAQQIPIALHALLITSSHRLDNVLKAVLRLNTAIFRVCVLIAILLVQSAQEDLSLNVVLVWRSLIFKTQLVLHVTKSSITVKNAKTVSVHFVEITDLLIKRVSV